MWKDELQEIVQEKNLYGEKNLGHPQRNSNYSSKKSRMNLWLICLMIMQKY